MKKKVLVIVGVLVIAAGIGVFAMNRAQTPDHTAMMGGGMNTVVTSRVHSGDIRQSITANGMVALERIEPIFSSAQDETRLRVAEVLVDVGDYVEIGQTIVTYDVEDTLNTLNRQIRESEINLENQRLSLREFTMGPSEQERRIMQDRITAAQEGINTAQDRIRNAEITLNDTQNLLDPTRRAIEDAQRAYDQARTEFNVNQQIFTLGGITRDALDQSAQDVETARQRLIDSQHDLENLFLTIDTRQRELETTQRGLEDANRSLDNEEFAYTQSNRPLATESAQIAHTRAVNNLELAQSAHNSLVEQRDRLVSETISHTGGMVTSVEVTVGEQVTGTSTLIEVSDFSNLIVTAEIREVDAPQVFVGQSVSMTSAGLAGEVYMGTITRVSPTAISRQAQMGTEIVVPIEITVENPDGNLRPGFSVDIEIILIESLDTVSISLMSILQDFETGQEYVFIIDENDTLRRRDITRGITTPLEIEITEGLEDGDRIILTPTPMMQDGDPLPEDAVEVGGGMPGMGMDGGGARQGGGAAVRVGGGGGGGIVIRQ